jgi:branched-chain amino acid transport system ATP-binding protein
MLELLDINTYYGDSHILQGVSLSVKRGQVVAVLGRNGVGKTTLLHSIVSFVKPRAGRILIEDEDITNLTTHQIMRRGLTLVPQGRRVFRSLSVAENLSIPFRCIHREGWPNQAWEIQEVYEAFPTLRARRHQRAGNLSGGEQQMLAMGRALVSGPKIILLDEPSEGLAPVIVQQISEVITQLAEQQIAVLLVEQNFKMALNLASRIFVMSRGQIVHQSSPDELVHNQEVKARFLGM